MRAAKRINAEGERIIEKADDEARSITSRAQEQAAFLIGERGLLERAEVEGLQILAEARSQAELVRAGADDYALGMLETLELEVGKALAGVQKGIAVLDERRADLAAAEIDASFEHPDSEGEALGEYDQADADSDEDRPTYR